MKTVRDKPSKTRYILSIEMSIRNKLYKTVSIIYVNIEKKKIEIFHFRVHFTVFAFISFHCLR